MTLAPSLVPKGAGSLRVAAVQALGQAALRAVGRQAGAVVRSCSEGISPWV